MAQNRSVAELQVREFKAVLLDLDGTLYHQPVLRIFMAVEMLWLPFSLMSLNKARKVWNAIYVFRKSREELRESHSPDESIATLEYRVPAERLGIGERELEAIVQEWIYRRPLKFLKLTKRSGIDGYFRVLRQSGISIGILSDYPAEEKLKALDVFDDIDLVLSATDPQVNAFKPDPRGFKKACKHWDLSADQVLYVGDRPEVDALGAFNAGMACVIIGDKGKHKHHNIGNFHAVSSFSVLTDIFRRL